MDKLDLVVQRIEDLKESTDNKLDSLKDSVEDRLDQYNDLLEVHIKRTDILEKLHIDNQDRIEILEEPTKVRKYVTDIILKIGGLAAAIVGVIKILEHFKV